VEVRAASIAFIVELLPLTLDLSCAEGIWALETTALEQGCREISPQVSKKCKTPPNSKEFMLDRSHEFNERTELDGVQCSHYRSS
jgi:hypothetical protein